MPFVETTGGNPFLVPVARGTNHRAAERIAPDALHAQRFAIEGVFTERINALYNERDGELADIRLKRQV
jgi:hypothetical protein